MTGTDDRIEAFLQDVLGFEGMTLAEVRENVRARIAECENDFANLEIEERNKVTAAQRCRELCRKRVLEKIDQSQGTTRDHWKIVLEVLDSPARFPLKP